MPGENPILRGFHPDPSICRVGGDYYLVTSTFEYFPGLPVHHSRDLVHWRLLGHVLDRPSQLPLHGVRPSGGLYAPTIRHHDGRFYVVCTLVDGLQASGNFVVTGDDPAGPWSEPVWLPDAEGFDPSLLFDEDGRCWYHACREVPGSPVAGRTEVWLRELDLATLRLVGEERVLWRGSHERAVWAEGPHLYRVGGRCILVTAEGGTELDHAVVVASADAVTGPYVAGPRTPALTHRDLGADAPIVAVGHADLVQAQDGGWWSVLLAMRPIDGASILGRETFLVPVAWRDGFPEFAPESGRVEIDPALPPLPSSPWPDEPAREDFDTATLSRGWSEVRTPSHRWWDLTARPGHLRLRLRPETLSDRANPSFLARPVRHHEFRAALAVELRPGSAADVAGLALRYSDDAWLAVVVTAGRSVTVLRCVRGAVGELATASVAAPSVELAVQATRAAWELWYDDGSGPHRLAALDPRFLSPEVSGGFVGTTGGPYASSNGEPSSGEADVDWFEYRPLPR